MHHEFEGLSLALIEKKKEQMLLQHHIDIQRLWRLINERPRDWYGALPHAEDAFDGATPPEIEGTHVQGFLGADLAAPSDPLGPPTSAVVREVRRDLNDNTLRYVGDRTAYSYDTSLTADEGTYVILAKVNGLWQFVWVGCEAVLLTIDDETGDPITDDDGDLLQANT